MGHRDRESPAINSFGERSPIGTASIWGQGDYRASCVGYPSAYLGPALALAMASFDAGGIANAMGIVTTVLVFFPRTMDPGYRPSGYRLGASSFHVAVGQGWTAVVHGARSAW